MRKILFQNKGAAVIMLAIGASVVGLIMTSSVLVGISSQRKLQRQINFNSDVNTLMNQMLTVILNDLKYAAHYPDADDLQRRILAPLSAKESLSNNEELPCGSKDPNDGNRYTLDAYLANGSSATGRCKLNHPGTYANTTKTFFYPITLAYLDDPTKSMEIFSFPESSKSRGGANTILIKPQSDPQVTITKIRPEQYAIMIDINVCNPPTPLPSICPASDWMKVHYDGVLNTKTSFFQK